VRAAAGLLPDVTRDELVEIVLRILADPAEDWYIAAFELNTVMPGPSGLIFHPPPELADATADVIVRRRIGLHALLRKISKSPESRRVPMRLFLGVTVRRSLALREHPEGSCLPPHDEVVHPRGNPLLLQRRRKTFLRLDEQIAHWSDGLLAALLQEVRRDIEAVPRDAAL
jgi:hypothetical protein